MVGVRSRRESTSNRVGQKGTWKSHFPARKARGAARPRLPQKEAAGAWAHTGSFVAWVGPEPLLSQGAAGQKSQLQRGGTGGAPWTCVLAGGTQQRLADQEGAHVALFSGGEGLVGGRAPERGARHCARKRRAVAWRPRAFAARGASVA